MLSLELSVGTFNGRTTVGRAAAPAEAVPPVNPTTNPTAPERLMVIATNALVLVRLIEKWLIV